MANPAHAAQPAATGTANGNSDGNGHASEKLPPAPFTLNDARRIYRIDQWGTGYFGIGENGNVFVSPHGKKKGPQVDLKALVDSLRQRGLETPLLIRFTDILQDRLAKIAKSFAKSIAEHAYTGNYRAVYPIKVNQQNHVVEEVHELGKAHGFGLEAGSKPELLAVLAIVDDDATPIICNGFKDSNFIEAVILAGKLGRNIIPVVEKYSELKLILKHAKAHGVRPQIGVRIKLSARGAGRWESSSGARSKFGLFASEILEMMDELRAENMLDCLKLLHCHVGSQINDIASVKRAITELARVYADLKKEGGGLEILDIGGGLGVDYDGSKSSTDGASINYTLQEYANDIVYYIKQVCDDEGITHPNIISESGRAMVAHHSVLIMDVMGWTAFERFRTAQLQSKEQIAELTQPVATLYEAYHALDEKNYRECYHDAVLARDQALSLFNLGYCPLKERAMAESLFYGICAKAHAITSQMENPPEEFDHLETQLAEIYFCNCSIFQSLPDAWAIDQVFPIMPIHRLAEKPTCHGILADITCDSDGKLDNFIGEYGNKPVLDLHPYTGERYELGVFLIGAYQETLGDLHNLFGDTNAVHVSVAADGTPMVEEVVEADTIREVLSYVQFDPDDLRRDFGKTVEKAVQAGKLTVEEAKLLKDFYTSGLNSSTYLV